MRWIINQNAVTQLNTVGISPALLGAFNLPSTYSNDAASFPAATRSATVTSLAAMIGGTYPAGSAVLYDLEKWPQSPATEQADPVGSAGQAAAWAHQDGLKLIFTPGINLAQKPNQDKYGLFLATNWYTHIAPLVDVVEIQAQQLQGTDRYAAFVKAAVAQIRTGNPNVEILAGLSSMPLGNPVEAWQLIRDFNRTKAIVDGYWLNIPVQSAQCPTCGDGNPQAALDFLTAIVVDF